MNTTNKVSGISKFLFSTLVAAAAMTSTAFAEDTLDISKALTDHGSYENRITDETEISVSDYTATADSATKLWLYTDADLSLTGSGTIDTTAFARFYLMDTIWQSGTAKPESVDADSVATVTLGASATLKGGLINLGQAIDDDDLSEEKAKRDGGAVNFVVNGTVEAKAFYVGSYSTLTVSDTGKIAKINADQETVIRAGGKIIINGTGADNLQYETNWISNQGGSIELNDTYAKTGKISLSADSRNAILTSDGASLTLKKSKLEASDIVISSGSGVSLTDSTLTAQSITNEGTFSVSGTSAVSAKVSGSGWVYMDGVNLDGNTSLDGAKVRFASGTNTIDGATIDNGFFQVGIGAYNGTDERVDTEKGVTVNVQNNAHIGASGVAYAGWVGSGFYDTDEEKAVAMTDARYTLNIDKSIAEFGYLHVSSDGVLNVTNNADTKANYNNSDYSFYAGDFIVNGTATFDNTDVLALYTKVSCDNGTDAPGHLIIKNGTYYEAERHNGAIDGTNFTIYKTGVVDVLSGSTLHIGENASIAEAGKLNVDNATLQVLGTVTNNGEINVSGESTITNTKISGTGTTRFSGTTNFYGENEITTTYIKGTPFNLVVNKGASLLITRFVLGYDRNITVYGEIEDATALNDATGQTLSLKANSTSGFSIGGTGTGGLDVHNAYVELGNSSWKDAHGTYTWKFDNSYVSAASFGNNNAAGSDSATWTVDFSDSKLVAKNYIKTAKGVTYNFKNGSVATTGSIRIDGVLDIDATSVVDVTSYQNNVKGGQDEHGDISGTVNVAGTLNITSVNQVVELRGGEINVDGGKLNLTKTGISVDADSVLNLKNGGTLTAVDVTNNGTITLNNATLVVTGTLTNNGTLTMLGDSKISDGTAENGSGVALKEITVATESGLAVEISATANILFSGIQEITVAEGEIDVSSITNGKVAGAWHFDIDGIGDGESVTVSTKVDAGLSLNTIKVFHKADGTDANWKDVTDDVVLTYDTETGMVSFTTNAFSSYAVAVPEPSAFGLLAGLGAIALAVLRRRRRTR